MKYLPSTETENQDKEPVDSPRSQSNESNNNNASSFWFADKVMQQIGVERRCDSDREEYKERSPVGPSKFRSECFAHFGGGSNEASSDDSELSSNELNEMGDLEDVDIDHNFTNSTVREEKIEDDLLEEAKDANQEVFNYSFQYIPYLQEQYKLYDILRHDHVKKQSYMFIRVERELYLFRDGSIAYLEHTTNPNKPLLKAHIPLSAVKRVSRDNDSITLETKSKPYKFFFNSIEKAETYAELYTFLKSGQ